MKQIFVASSEGGYIGEVSGLLVLKIPDKVEYQLVGLVNSPSGKIILKSFKSIEEMNQMFLEIRARVMEPTISEVYLDLVQLVTKQEAQ